MKLRKLLALPLAALLMLSTTGCSGYQTAERVTHVIDAIVTLAQGDLPAFQAAGAFNATEAAIANNYLATLKNLNGQYGSCVDAAQSAKLTTKGKFLACLNIFLQGATDPSQLAQFRVFNPKAQQRVQLWVAAIQMGVNTAIVALGGTTKPTVQVAVTATPTAELAEFRARVLSGL